MFENEQLPALESELASQFPSDVQMAFSLWLHRQNHTNHYFMFRHHLVIIFRTFKHNKTIFFINLLGLSVGLACSLLIYLWVHDEMNVDRFHKNNDDLYQVLVNLKQSNGIVTDVNGPALLAETLVQDFPEVKYAANTTGSFQDLTLTVNHNHFNAWVQFANKDYFKVFSFPLLVGDVDQVLANKNAVVLSESLAKKMFGTTENIIGKPLRWEYLTLGQDCIVSGIFKDVPVNSSEQFECVFSFEAYKDIDNNKLWGNLNAKTYVVLNKGVNPAQFSRKIADVVKAHVPESNATLFTVPFSSFYLHGKFENGAASGGRIEYVKLFSIIAIFILVIACINFMNLSTARAAKRLKEVGIKKVVGAQKWTLVTQYLSESMLLTLFSFILAAIMVIMLLPQFNHITGKQLTLTFDVNLVLTILGIIFFTGLVAGSYPAFYLSGFQPVAILKNKLKSSVGELFARKGLVVFQFILSILLIVAVLVCQKQIEFVQTKNLGYHKDNVLYFKMQGSIPEHLESFLTVLKNTPGVLNASSMGRNITEGGNTTSAVNWSGKDANANISFENIPVYYDLIETLGMEMKEGHSYSRNFGSDSTGVIFNETAIKAMGLKDPVGKKVNVLGKDKHIIGVVKDFHFQSLHQVVKPLMLGLVPEDDNKIIAKVKAGEELETIERIEKVHKQYNPGFPFDYKFLDADYQALYVAENRVGVLSGYFAGLAIFISGLGLFGLAAFTVERRQKEIGIRKVLGSSAFDIFYLLSRGFIQLVLVSIIVALPISYLIVKSWLDTFAYRINLSIWFFIIAGGLTLLIAWVTVAMQAIKAAYANPLKGIKSE